MDTFASILKLNALPGAIPVISKVSLPVKESIDTQFGLLESREYVITAVPLVDEAIVGVTSTFGLGDRLL